MCLCKERYSSFTLVRTMMYGMPPTLTGKFMSNPSNFENGSNGLHFFYVLLHMYDGISCPATNKPLTGNPIFLHPPQLPLLIKWTTNYKIQRLSSGQRGLVELVRIVSSLDQGLGLNSAAGNPSWWVICKNQKRGWDHLCKSSKRLVVCPGGGMG